MARATTTDQQINGNYTNHLGASKFTMSGWMRRNSSGSIQAWGFNENNNHRTCLLHFSDNNMYYVVSNGSSANGYALKNVTGWHHWAMVFDGSQTGIARIKGFYDGTQQTLSALGSIPATISSNVANEAFRIGRAQANNVWSVGDFTELGMWTEALSNIEISSLSKGITPAVVRPDKLFSYTPLIRDIQDVRSGTTLTDTSTTVATHPRIYP